MTAVPDRSEFNLKKGMSDTELWKELERVGISGETKQEVITFKKPELTAEDHTQIPLHNVVMCNNKYAIIRKSKVYNDIFGSVNESWTYYFCGINDEHKYFIRPMNEFPWKEKPKLSQIVDYINRAEEGFLKRAQGDVLIKFVELGDLEETEAMRRAQRALLPEGQFELDDVSPRANLLRGLTGASFRTRSRRNFHDRMMARHRRMDENSLIIDEKRYERVEDSPLKLGNHKVWVDGEVYASREVPYVAIVSDQLILQHYEHKTEEIKIPKGSVAILAAQRGRDFELGNLNYLRSSYD